MAIVGFLGFVLMFFTLWLLTLPMRFIVNNLDTAVNVFYWFVVVMMVMLILRIGQLLLH